MLGASRLQEEHLHRGFGAFYANNRHGPKVMATTAVGYQEGTESEFLMIVPGTRDAFCC